MPKWKSPDAECPGVSVAGQWFDAVHGVVTLPDEPEFAADFTPFGFEQVAEEPAPEPAPARASRATK